MKTYVVGLFQDEIFVSSFLQSTREHRMGVIDLLVCFVTRHIYLASVRYDDVVAAVHCGNSMRYFLKKWCKTSHR